MYAKCLKRVMDVTLSVLALVVLSPVLLLLMIVGAIAMQGNPFFLQPRPGKKGKDGKEKIFKLIKLRTMSNAKDKDGNLLPDDQRLGKYGAWLRSTSLDELPELINIATGSLSLCGPRPFLVRDVVFMSEEQRRRHEVRPGLTGLAQVNGRNNITWEQKNTLKDKIDVKKTVLSNVIPVGCLVVGIILFFVGLGISVPSDYISSYSMTEYVGGDAYNFIIEASLRGGRIAAAQISKGIYICVGLLIACVSALKINVVKPSKENE